MGTFVITLGAVAVLLFAAVPGFVFIKAKLVSENFISGISKILVYICQPCITVYTFLGVEFSVDALKTFGVFTLLAIALHAVMLLGVFAALRRRSEAMVYRIVTIASTFCNCTFFGIPIIEAVIPNAAPELLACASIYSLVMNVFCWTIGSAIITRDKKYISLKKVFLNPITISTAVAFALFAAPFSLGSSLLDMITLMGKMATPLSMLVLGMRIATVSFKALVADARLWLGAALKQLAMPLVAFALVAFLPLGQDVKAAFFVIAACPTASVVLNFSEILGEGQREASCAVLLSTVTSIVTMPVMLLLLQFL